MMGGIGSERGHQSQPANAWARAQKAGACEPGTSTAMAISSGQLLRDRVDVGGFSRVLHSPLVGGPQFGRDRAVSLPLADQSLERRANRENGEVGMPYPHRDVVHRGDARPAV